MKILKTLIGKITVGFAIVFLLMIGTTYVAIDNQQKIAGDFQSLSDDVIPLLQLAYDMQIQLQNANKSVSQHAASEDTEVLESLLAEFEQSRAAYQKDLNAALDGLAENSPLRARLVESDVLAMQSLALGAEHIAKHREILEVSLKFSETYQAVTAKWLGFDGDMRLVEMTMNRLRNEGDPNADKIDVDARLVMERLRQIRTSSAAVVGIFNMDTLEVTVNNLQRITNGLQANMDGLEANANFIHRKSVPYYELAQSLTGSEDALFDLYIRMNEIELEGAELLARVAESVNQTLTFQQSFIEDVTAITAETASNVEETNSSAFVTLLGVLGVSLLIGALIVFSVLRSIRKPLSAITTVLAKVGEGDLSRQVPVTNNDEFGTIAVGLNGLIDSLREVITDISKNASVIEQVTDQVSSNTQNSLGKLKEQKERSGTIVGATQQLTESSDQISDGASSTLNEVQDVSKAATQSKQNVNSSLQYVDQLSKGLNSAGEVINNLQKESENISQILTVIQGIAEQTNLLALNAAIEAARAGEQGRGFAVVADEVRNLASKTQSSTEEIYAMIESFQKQANAAATTMQDNLSKIDTLVENSNVTDQSVQAILDSLQRINAMSADIDQQTSAQRQTVASVAEDVEQIAQIADGILGNASRNAEAFKELNELVEKQSRSVSTFRLG